MSYFRWRQYPNAQEQLHAGLLRPDAVPARAFAEVSEAAADPATMVERVAAHKEAALLSSYPSEMITQIQPQGERRSALWAVFDSDSALRRLRLNVDIHHPDASLEGYGLVVAPCLSIISEQCIAQLRGFEGPIVIGPRGGSRSKALAVPKELAQGKTPIKVRRGQNQDWHSDTNRINLLSHDYPMINFVADDAAAYANGMALNEVVIEN